MSISRVVATTISRYLAGVIRQRLWAEATHTEKGAKREGRVRVVSHSKQRLWVRQNLSVTLSLDDLCARPKSGQLTATVAISRRTAAVDAATSS